MIDAAVNVPSDGSNCDSVKGVLKAAVADGNGAVYVTTSPNDDPMKATADNEPARTPARFEIVLWAIRFFFFLVETDLELFIEFSPSERI